MGFVLTFDVQVILAGYGIVSGAVAVLVFVAENEMPNIRQFSIQKDSLSLSGAAGFVAVRFEYVELPCFFSAGLSLTKEQLMLSIVLPQEDQS